MSIRTYSELSSIGTYKGRLEYLKRSDGRVGQETFGHERYLNQSFYSSREWKRARRKVIIRDCGCDLGMDGYEIYGRIIIHHLNTIRPDDIIHRPDLLVNPEYLITCSFETHNAIHFGNIESRLQVPLTRFPNDTAPWRNTDGQHSDINQAITWNHR